MSRYFQVVLTRFLVRLFIVYPLLRRISQISPPFRNFRAKKGNKPLLPSPYYSSLINARLYKSITTAKRHLNWSRVVFDPRLHDLQLPVLNFSTLHSSYLCRADITIFAKLNKPPPPPISNKLSVSISLPSNVFEIYKPLGEEGIEDLHLFASFHSRCSFSLSGHFSITHPPPFWKLA